jgi:hypothetical protein
MDQSGEAAYGIDEGGDDAVDADEVYLLGMFDDILVAGDFTVA